MIRNLRTVAMGGCVATLAVMSIATVAMAEDPAPNCFCGPVDNCAGVPIKHQVYCPSGQGCACHVTTDPDNGNCITSIMAYCVTYP